MGLTARLRRRWKTVVLFVGIWLIFLFPIPLLPFWGVRVDQNTITTTIIITTIVTIPFTFLAIFMNDGSKGSGTLRND